ncbi:MAG: MFS transporter [Bacillota bacterium]
MPLLHDLFHQFRGLPRSIKLFYVSDLFFAFGQAIFLTLFNLHLLKVGYDASHIGTLQWLSGLLMAAAAVPIGVIADRFGRRGLYIAGSILYGIPYAVMPLLTDFRLLLTAYAIHSLGMVLMMVNEGPLLAGEVGTEKRASVFSFMMINFFLWNTIGIQVAGLLVRWLPAGQLSEYVWPLALAGFCGVAAGLMRAFLPFKPYKPARQGFRLLPSRTALLLAGVSLLSGSFSALLQNFANVVLAERFAFGAEAVATVLTVAGVLGWVASLFVPWLSGRLGDLRGYVLVVALQAVVLLYLGLAESPGAYVPGFWLRTALTNMQMPLFAAFAMGVTAESERATANSYAMVGRNVGTAFASHLFGTSLAAGSYLLPFALASLLALGAAGATLAAFRESPSARRTDLQI